MKRHPEPRMSKVSRRQAWNTADAVFQNQTNRKISQGWQNGSMHKNTYKPDNLISKAKIHTHWKNKTTKRKNNSQVMILMW